MSDIRLPFQKFRFACGAIALILILGITTTGCEALRKKFIRKKSQKEKSEEFVPVLDPVEYPETVYTSQDRYKKLYSLWRIWQREMTSALTENQSSKRQRYILSQMIVQVEEMRGLLRDEKKETVGEVFRRLKDLEKDMQAPAPMRNLSIIKLKLRRISETMRDELKFAAVEDYIR